MLIILDKGTMVPGCGNRCGVRFPGFSINKRGGVRVKGSGKSKTYYIHSSLHAWMRKEDKKFLNAVEMKFEDDFTTSSESSVASDVDIQQTVTVAKRARRPTVSPVVYDDTEVQVFSGVYEDYYLYEHSTRELYFGINFFCMWPKCFNRDGFKGKSGFTIHMRKCHLQPLCHKAQHSSNLEKEIRTVAADGTVDVQYDYSECFITLPKADMWINPVKVKD